MSAPSPGPESSSGPEPTSAANSAASRRTLLLGVVLTVAVLVAAGVVAVSGSGGTSGDDTTGDPGSGTLADRVAPTDQAPLPEMTLGGFGDGEPVSTTDYRGKPLVLNFWGSWCAPCVDEMPDLQRLADAADGRVAVLGVNYQDQAGDAQALVDELAITYDLAVDDGGELFRAVEAFGMPTTLFVDADGRIRYRQTGPADAVRLAELVAVHLGTEIVVDG